MNNVVTLTRPAYLWDLDGTLSDCSHRAHYLDSQPVDWDGFFKDILYDRPLEFAANLFRALAQYRPGKCALVITTCRPQRTHAHTALWLRIHKLQPDLLLMRDDSDRRVDVEVKHAMLQYIRERCRMTPVLALDDRAPIVNMYRSEGVPCYHVAAGGAY